jgi:hypothetical protein
MPPWDGACPKCRYHPDSYNRAQDDVAALFRLGWASERTAVVPATPMPPGTVGAATAIAPAGWRGWLPHWLGGGGQPPQANA